MALCSGKIITGMKHCPEEAQASMQEACRYHIEIAGLVEERDFNAAGPLAISVERASPDATRFAIISDQAGLIGLLRYLHSRGFVLISVLRSSDICHAQGRSYP